MIPDRFVSLAADWYNGQNDMLYAVSSSGGLFRGTQRPYNDDEGRYMNDEEWDLSLWQSLESDIFRARKLAEKSNHPDSLELWEFECFVESQIESMQSV